MCGGTWHKLPLCVESYQDTGLMLGEEPAVWKQGTSGNMGSTWERWARGSLQGSLGEERGEGPKTHGISCLLPPPLLPLGGSAGDSSCESRGGVQASSCRYWHEAWGMIYPLQPQFIYLHFRYRVAPVHRDSVSPQAVLPTSALAPLGACQKCEVSSPPRPTQWESKVGPSSAFLRRLPGDF